MKCKVKEMRMKGSIEIKLSNKKTWWRADKATLIRQITSVIESYQSRHIALTLRQLYYQLVSQKIRVMPNDAKTYKKLGDMVTDLREAGIVDWDAIEDRHRDLETPVRFADVPSALDSLADQYRADRQRDQPNYLECWIEKAALASLAYDITSRYSIPLLVSRGYNSATAIWEASRRFLASTRPVKILYMGDHDPSGLDMVRDISARLHLYAPDADVEVIRVALLESQVQEHSLPPNPIKDKDARKGWYRDNYGDDTWELDALDAAIFQSLLEHAIHDFFDIPRLQRILSEETSDRLVIQAVAAASKAI